MQSGGMSSSGLKVCNPTRKKSLPHQISCHTLTADHDREMKSPLQPKRCSTLKDKG